MLHWKWRQLQRHCPLPCTPRAFAHSGPYSLRRFLPKFKKKNVRRKKSTEGTDNAAEEKKVYTPFPPPMPSSKMDLQLESGEYFLSEDQKRERARAAKDMAQEARTAERQRQRQAAFVAPKVCVSASR